MKLESACIKGFRCFGPEGTTIDFETGLTVLIGGNGAGKTSLFHSLSRLFGVTPAQRAVRKRDFHLSADCDQLRSGAQLSIDVVLAFPELQDVNEDDVGDAVPEFFLQMAASEPGARLKCRIVLKATWTDDGTPSGYIDEDIRWVRTLGRKYDWDDHCQKVLAVQRGTMQLIYVPATRKVEEQVTALLKGRLWNAAKWSEDFRENTSSSADQLQAAFQAERPASFALKRLKTRWQQVHEADTDTTPILRLVEHRFEEFVRKADFAFCPDEAGQERNLSELSDGQRSLFHIALTAATLEVERDAFSLSHEESPFDQEKLSQAHLTILAIEEPENSLSPFFLSRIVSQARDIGALETAQVIASSHSAAILSRIEPEEVRYFRLDRTTRLASVRKLSLPTNDTEARQFVRLAVRAYPELYFARFVILGEGDSERLVVPRVAEAMGVFLDPSFVPIVPLGGRYCCHFWKLLSDLEIPFATLLDFDIGRKHGGANLIRSVVENLQSIGVDLDGTSEAVLEHIDPSAVDALKDNDIWLDYEQNHWVQALEGVSVFLSDPLDLDFAMLWAFPMAYQHPHPGGSGPLSSDKALTAAKSRTLKSGGDASLYEDEFDEEFRWYSYLFLSRSKPETHLLALTRMKDAEIAKKAPPSILSLIKHVRQTIDGKDDC